MAGRKAGATVHIDVSKLMALVYESAGTKRGSQEQFTRNCGIEHNLFCKIKKRGVCSAEMLTKIAEGTGKDYNDLLEELAVIDNKPMLYRLRAGLSRLQLAKLAGVSVATISDLEDGRSDCYTFTAACLAKVLGVPMGVYLGYEE